MLEKEEFLYQIMGKISEADAPIVFKGAMITKLILAENGFTELERVTKDIDANWIGSPPSTSEIVDIINHSFGELKDQVYAVAFREYGEKMSAGISIRDKKTDDEIVSMDIDMRPIYGCKLYHYGEIAIHGVIPDSVLSDKISVLSGERIFRRVKDVLDVYAVARCLEINTVQIYSALDKIGRELGSFEAFLTRRADLEHAYGKMRGIINKPDFDSVYTYLCRFLEPFITRDKSPKVWHSSETSWGFIVDK